MRRKVILLSWEIISALFTQGQLKNWKYDSDAEKRDWIIKRALLKPQGHQEIGRQIINTRIVKVREEWQRVGHKTAVEMNYFGLV